MDVRRDGDYLLLAKSEYQHEVEVGEKETLLPEPVLQRTSGAFTKSSCHKYGIRWLVVTYVAGFASCAMLQYLFPSFCLGTQTRRPSDVGSDSRVTAHASSYAGQRTSQVYPPISPTNNLPSYFPTNVGYAGPTFTGVEAGIIATAPRYPLHTDAPNLVGPSKMPGPRGKEKSKIDIFKLWGNLRYEVIFI